MPVSANSDITYELPPLVEVAMSVQFAPPKGFHLGHFGLLWSLLKADYPHAQAAQPILPLADDFGGKGSWLPQTLRLALIDSPECRLQMSSADERWMCQIQQDRIVANWRKRESEYPRYGATLQRFGQSWEALHQLFINEGLDSAKPLIWELTYVNQIPSGGLWKSPSDWPKVLPGLWGSSGVGPVEGARLHGLLGQWVWQSTDECARVIVEPKPHRAGSTESLFLNITSRGTLRYAEELGTSFDRIKRGLQNGHSMIVSTFDAVISDEAKREWKRQ